LYCVGSFSLRWILNKVLEVLMYKRKPEATKGKVVVLSRQFRKDERDNAVRDYRDYADTSVNGNYLGKGISRTAIFKPIQIQRNSVSDFYTGLLYILYLYIV